MTTKRTLKRFSNARINIIDSVGSGIFWKDIQGNYLGCNTYFALLAGLLTPRDIEKQTDATLPWKSQSNLILKNDTLVIANNMQLCTTEDWQVEHGAVHTFLINRTPLYDDSKRIIGIAGTLIDITNENEIISTKERHINEISSQKKLAFYMDLVNEIAGESVQNLNPDTYISYVYEYLEKIISCMPGNVYWLNKNAIFLGCNDNVAKMLGLRSRMDIIGMTHKKTAELAHWSAGQAESFEKDDKEVITTGVSKINVEEPPITDVNGREIYFLTNRVPLKNANNEVIGVVGISIDITDRKQAETAKKDFLSNMEHDLRTPFAGIGGVADLLNSVYANQYPELKDLLGILVKSCSEWQGVHNRIFDALDLRQAIKIEKFYIQDELDRIHNLMRATSKIKKIDFFIHCQSRRKTGKIRTDRLKLSLILSSLIDNAFSFTEKGQIDINVSFTADEFIIEIIDTGIGIARDKFDYIFEKFTKLSRSNTYGSVFKGMGMGLYNARKDAKRLGGNITVDSIVGKGSVFILTLPITI